MDSFFSLFDPTDDQSSTDNTLDTVKKKGDVPKGRRRGRRSQGKNETLPEESSFLCEPDLSSELLVKEGSYIESFYESPKKSDDPKDADSKPKRRISARKSRRKKSKVSPAKELLPNSSWTETEQSTLNNKNSRSGDKRVNVGKNVNNLQECDIDSPEYVRKSRRKAEPFDADDVYRAPHEPDDSQVYNVIDQLERVSLSKDEFAGYSELSADCSETYDEDDYEDSASQLSDSSEECYGSLPPEPRFGNVEYKLQLLSPSEARFQHLVTQLKWRLGSGGGTARYVLGVRDAGAVRGLRPRALRASLRTLRRMATALGASVTATARRVAPHRAVAEAVLKKMAETQQSVELRVAVMGANEAGKSTLIGVLTQGELDNGRGSARLNMFRHVHEVRSGRTSSLSHEILGFDAQGNVVNYGCSELMTAERIGERSAKLVSFLDLAGHSKYQRTTVHGLTGYRPHYSMLLVSAVAGITSITEEHLSLLLALELPFFVVLTKSELAPPRAVDEALSGLATLLAHAGKKPLLIRDENLARTCVHPQTLIRHIRGGERRAPIDGPALEAVPVFPVSCVRGSGLAALHAYLLALQPPLSELEPQLEEEPCEFQIDEVFHMDAASGPVVGGLLARGRLREGDHLLIGPLITGDFVPITVKSIYRNRAPTDLVRAGQSASLGLGRRLAGLRQGMVLLAVPQHYRSTAAAAYPHCAPGKCKSRALDIIASKQSPEKKKNTKNERRKEKNLLKDIEIAQNSLKKETDTDVAGNIYISEESDVEEAVSASEMECVCKDKVYLEDPNNPRGCLYFQATIHLQKHSAEYVYPGFQCTVHIGNVRQTAVVEGVLTGTGCVRTGTRASALFRFARAPEHVRGGARLLCRAGERTRAVGRVTQAFPHVPGAPQEDVRSDEDGENNNCTT